jgi:hypothetical protein
LTLLILCIRRGFFHCCSRFITHWLVFTLITGVTTKEIAVVLAGVIRASIRTFPSLTHYTYSVGGYQCLQEFLVAMTFLLPLGMQRLVTRATEKSFITTIIA